MTLDPGLPPTIPIEPFKRKWRAEPATPLPLTASGARQKARDRQKKYRNLNPQKRSRAGPKKQVFDPAETERQAAALKAWIAGVKD